VVHAVAGEEGHPPAFHGADRDRRRRRAVGRVHRHLDDIVEELVEPGAAEDPELDGVHGRRRQEAAAVPDVEVDAFEPEESDDDDVELEPESLLVDDESLLAESLDDDVVDEADFFDPERLSVL
jgi:hypothetical protein